MNSQLTKAPSLFALLVMASFASFGAVLLAPALPAITQYFHQSTAATEAVMTYYLIGYALGLLIYGPLANRLGRKKALMCGVLVALFGSVICVVAPLFHSFPLLVIGRFLVAIGAASGIVIAMVIIKDMHDEIGARRQFAKVVLAFALVPFISITLGGNIAHYLVWQFGNVVMMLYTIFLGCIAIMLDETLHKAERSVLTIKSLVRSYKELLLQADYMKLIWVYAICAVINYVFNAIAPIIVIDNMHISSVMYGWLSVVPSIGILVGGYLSSRFSATLSANKLIIAGIMLLLSGSVVLTILFAVKLLQPIAFYALAVIIFGGTALIIPNASMQALSRIKDHASGSSLMNASGLITSGLFVGLAGRFIESYVIVMPLIILVLSIVSLLFMYSVHAKNSLILKTEKSTLIGPVECKIR